MEGRQFAARPTHHQLASVAAARPAPSPERGLDSRRRRRGDVRWPKQDGGHGDGAWPAKMARKAVRSLSDFQLRSLLVHLPVPLLCGGRIFFYLYI